MNTPEYRKAYMSNFKLDATNNAMLGIDDSKIVKPKTITKPKINKIPGKAISTAKSDKLKKEKTKYFDLIFFKLKF
jgi:hypothetical protein